MKVGERIKQYLSENKITQVWLSENTGISTPKLNLALSGKRKMTFGEYALICGALRVNTDKFIQPETYEKKQNDQTA